MENSLFCNISLKS